MAKDERTEDLNPRGEDIDEKVRRMLDPSVPDEDEQSVKVTKKPSKPKVEAVSPALEDNTSTAPELPNDEIKTNSQVASKKVIIPISHDKDDEVKQEPVKAKSQLPTAVRKIAVDDAEKSPEDVAEKLDEAIAELETDEPDVSNASLKDEPPQKEIDEPQTAPVLDAAAVEVLVADEPEKDTQTLPAPGETGGDKAESPLPETGDISDPATDKAVDEIVSSESDVLLEVEDAIRDTDEPVKASKDHKGFGSKLSGLFKNRAFQKVAIFGVLILIIVVGLVPASRYFFLNTIGIRVSSSVTVLDNSTGLPLKNVQVSLGQASAKTDDEGNARFEKLELGPTNLKIERLAFSGVEKPVTLGLGSNNLGEHKLLPTGEQYDFKIIDYLSGKPVIKAEATSGEASAFSDDQGNIKLTVPQPEADKLVVKVSAKDYRTETLTFDAVDQKPKEVKLVTGRKHVFISKRSGNYDIYSVYVDGQDEKLVLAGSGRERDDMVLLSHPSVNMTAYVSTRADKRNADGYLLSTLLLINLETNETTNVLASEKIQLVGWTGDRLVFVKTIGASSAADPKRSQLLSYNYQDNTTKELATSNYFNDVLLAQGLVYFAPSSAYAGGTPAQFYRINADGSGQQSLLNQETWAIIRSAYDHISLSVNKLWYDFQLGNSQATRLASAPASQKGRAYLDSPDGKTSLWIDQRDGKGVLLKYDLATKKDTILVSHQGLTYPVSWLNSHTITYRVDDEDGTADYAMSINGGEPRKIRDVTHIDGADNWYYY